ncbi:MAG: hypothetical protein NTV33_10375 [Coprothermobacterota bacterium]|nr:hypothetical protein [Coprothermobacterota bacterium]
MPLLENGDMDAGFRQFRCTGQSGWTCANDRHPFSPGGRRDKHSSIEGIEPDIPCVFDEKPLKFSDLNRIANAARTALLLAKPSCRTQNPARASKNIIMLDGLDRSGYISQAQFANEAPRICFSRASFGAGGVETQQASFSLGNRLSHVKPLVHVV